MILHHKPSVWQWLSKMNYHQALHLHRIEYTKAPRTHQSVIGAHGRDYGMARTYLQGTLAMLLIGTLAGCGAQHDAQRRYVASIAPLGMILHEVVGDRAEVHTLLQPGASPHTYEPRPSDVRNVESARALFYVDESLDGWAAELPAVSKIDVLAMVPESFLLPSVDEDAHSHGPHDPHFWGDPLAVKAAVPGLVTKLSSLDPEGAAGYDERGKRFIAALDQLDARLRDMMAPVKGKPVVMFHPAWNYFLHRYGLELVALVEPSPGKEATAQHITQIADTIRARGVTAVFTEPQLARRPAEVVAEAGGVPVYVLDPLGGVPGKMTYEDLLLSNAQTMLEALQ